MICIFISRPFFYSNELYYFLLFEKSTTQFIITTIFSMFMLQFISMFKYKIYYDRKGNKDE